MTRHPAERRAAEALAALRALDKPLRPEPNKPLVPNMYFSWDAEGTEVDLELLEEPGGLVSIVADIAGSPRWFNLSLALGDVGFSAGDVLGLAIRAENRVSLAPFMRSGIGGNLGDTDLGYGQAGAGDRRPFVLLRKVTGADAVTGAGAYHTLILPLPQTSFRLRLGDLRFFVLPAAQGAEPDLPRLGSFAL